MRSAKRIHCLGQSRLRLLRGCVLAAVLLVGALPGCSDSTDLLIPIDPPDELRGGDAYPAWSPDGRTVAFVSVDVDSVTQSYEKFLRKVDVVTGEATTVRSVQGLVLHSLSWGPDGRWLVFSTTVGIFKMLATGDSLTRLTAGQYHVSVSWSRVSNRIFFARNAGSERGIYSMDPDGSNQLRWTYPETLAVEEPYCFPDSDTLTVHSFDESGLLCLALYLPGRSTLAEVFECGLGWLGSVRVSPDHRFLAFNSVEIQSERVVTILSLLDRSDGTVRVLTRSMTEVCDFSPHGDRIVYPDLAQSRGLQIIDIRTGEVSQLTPGHP